MPLRQRPRRRNNVDNGWNQVKQLLRMDFNFFAWILYFHVWLVSCVMSQLTRGTRELTRALAVMTILFFAVSTCPLVIKCVTGRVVLAGVKLDQPSLLDVRREELSSKSPSNIVNLSRVSVDVKLSGEAEKHNSESFPSLKLDGFASLLPPIGSRKEKGEKRAASPSRALHRIKRGVTANRESYIRRLTRKVKAVIMPEKNYFKLIHRLHRWFWNYKAFQKVSKSSMKNASEVFRETYARVDRMLIADDYCKLTNGHSDNDFSAIKSGSDLDDLDSLNDESAFENELLSSETSTLSRSSSVSSSLSADMSSTIYQLDSLPTSDDFDQSKYNLIASGSGVNGDENLNYNGIDEEPLEEEYDVKKVESMDFVYNALKITITKLEGDLEERKMKESGNKDLESLKDLEADIDPVDDGLLNDHVSQEQVVKAMARAKRSIMKGAKNLVKNELEAIATVAVYKGLAICVTGITITNPAIAAYIIEPLVYLLGGASTPISVGYLRDIKLRAALSVAHKIKPIPIVTCSSEEYAKFKSLRGKLKTE